MIEISRDSIIYNYTEVERLEFFNLILTQIEEVEKLLQKPENLDDQNTAGLLHKIKGSFSYFVEPDILAIIKSLELKAKSNQFNQEDRQNLLSLFGLIKVEIEPYLIR